MPGTHRGWRRPLAIVLCLTAAVPCAARSEERETKAEAASAIFGKVVDGRGAPIGGVRIQVYRYRPSQSRRWGRWEDDRRTVTSSASGAYRFDGLPAEFFMIVAEKPEFAPARCGERLEADKTLERNIVLKPPASPVIQLRDEMGRPAVGATVRQLTVRGPNGDCRLPHMWLKSLGLAIAASNEAGDLTLPPLPTGDTVKVTIDHPRLAPVEIENIHVASGASVQATMKPGVVVTLRFIPEMPDDRIASAVIDLRHEPFNNASTIVNDELEIDAAGVARLAIEPGDYHFLLLQHEDFYLTPCYSANQFRKEWLRIEPGRNDDLRFEVRRKATARGRVIDATTGKPLADMSIMGELADLEPGGKADLRRDKWNFAGWGETNAQGEYTISLAPGSARVSFEGGRFIAEHDHLEFTVAPDGSTVIPEIRARPLPKISGVVQNADGTPAARAVVRLRGRGCTGVQPVLTDETGRFELQPDWIPQDPESGERVVTQSLVAFDPYRPLAARTPVRLDRPEPALLTLEAHEPDWPLYQFPDEMGDWQRGIVPPDVAEKDAAVSLRGRPPPEIDADAWLNTQDQPLRLADLRGKFVLLDFWFTGCGPCHHDFASVKLVHELYKDRGVIVIGIHNNSSRPEAVRQHVAEIKLPFPVAVDRQAGTTVSRFERHGIPDGYPNYVLIGPDGNVLLDDRTIPHPALRNYKLEIIRQHVLAAGARAN